MKTLAYSLLCLTMALPGALAQSTFGTIVGRVRDSSGAVVDGATVTLRGIETNAVAATVSSSLGMYEFLNVKSGLYEISAGKSGFATARVTNMLLDARQTRRVDFPLEIAPRTDVVVVTPNVPRINTENGSVADSKSWEQITNLPLNYRGSRTNSPLVTVNAVPGVQQDQGGRLSIGGGLPSQIEISVDGISVVPIYSNLPDPQMTPSPEILGEFKVTSVDNTAEFGQMGDITMVSRGGANDWHGGAFWYHQNRALDATIYNAPIKQAKVFNTFGGSFSGPVEVPGYSGRNRTFFFADYEGNRRPQSQLDQLSVPTSEARSGDLTNIPGGSAINPQSGAAFPGNMIPTTSISSVARKLLSEYYPLPTIPNLNSGINYRKLTPVNDTLDGYDLRLDHVLTPAQHVFLRWSDKGETKLNDNAPLPSDTTSSRFQSLVIAQSAAWRPTLVNELRFGVAVSRAIENPAFPGRVAVANLGITGLDLVHAGDSGGFPGFFFDDGTGYTDIGVGTGRSMNLHSRNIQVTDTLSWIHGRHTVRVGGDVRHVGYNSPLHSGGYSDDFGAFEFDSQVFSGNAFADLLLGLPTYSYYAALGPNLSESATNLSVFAQDNWQVHPRLTLELGLRWEVHPPFQEASNNIANFDHQTGDVIIPDGSLPPAPSFLAAINACSVAVTQPCTKILTASQTGLPNGLRRTDYRNWNPRIGFAWQPLPDRQTVVRGAIGRYTESLLGFFAGALTGIASSDVRTFSNFQGPGLPPAFALPAATPPLSSLGSIGTESFFDGTDPTMKDPHSWQWNFTIEHELPLRSSFRASYVGVQSVGLPVRVDFNQVPASTTPFSTNRQPFQQWASLISLEGVGFSNYQGLTLEWSRRLRDGLFFQASYTLSKDLGETGTATSSLFAPEHPSFILTDRFDTRYDRGNLPGARRNRALFTGVFPLPFGSGRQLGGSWRGLRQSAFGGWEISTVGLIQSGPYQTPTISAGLDQSNTNIGDRAFARPDRIGNGNLSNPTPNQWYDASAFTRVPKGAGRFGNAGTGILEGPGTVAVAAGLSKTFRVTERLRLRTEATFTNLANHPNFQPPIVAVGTPNFGKLTSVQSAENGGNRTGQVAARLEF